MLHRPNLMQPDKADALRSRTVRLFLDLLYFVRFGLNGWVTSERSISTSKDPLQLYRLGSPHSRTAGVEIPLIPNLLVVKRLIVAIVLSCP